MADEDFDTETDTGRACSGADPGTAVLLQWLALLDLELQAPTQNILVCDRKGPRYDVKTVAQGRGRGHNVAGMMQSRGQS